MKPSCRDNLVALVLACFMLIYTKLYGDVYIIHHI
jgi:hypothetical protein